jgi:dolichol-phosphate mannosyltransferase
MQAVSQQGTPSGGAKAEAPPQVALSVVIPAFNERDTIQEALRRVRALAETGIVLLRHARNEGKGTAIRTALARVSGRVVAIQDADLEYDPHDLLRLMEPILHSEVRVVYGSRFLRGRPPMQPANYLCNRLLAITANVLYGGRLTDEATCYKLFDAELMRSIPLECRRFEFCPEVTAKLLRRGERIMELPISYEPRSYDSGKKIRWWDGVEALWTLVKYRFRK